jgi:hypothetical protein
MSVPRSVCRARDLDLTQEEQDALAARVEKAVQARVSEAVESAEFRSQLAQRLREERARLEEQARVCVGGGGRMLGERQGRMARWWWQRMESWDGWGRRAGRIAAAGG